MKKKIFYYLFKSYHRPLSKIEHFVALTLSIFFNKKTKILSEKFWLLKVPPMTMIYFNFLGRSVYFFANLLSFLILKKFLDKSIEIENQIVDKEKIKIGNDSIPWPVQAMHHYEEQNYQIDEKFYTEVFKSYKKSVAEYDCRDTEWWKKRRDEFKNLFIQNNSINKKNIKNFRDEIPSRAALLSDHNNVIKKKNFLLKNIFDTLLLVCLYHKYSEIVDTNILRSVSDSYAGNNKCVIYRGQRINHRILRYAYYISQLKNNIKLGRKGIVCDIGGGYGGLLRMIKYQYPGLSCVLVELPETAILASYFLKKNFPDKKILLYNEIDHKIKFDILNYDFVIIPPSAINVISDRSVDLIINTSSLSEMDENTQDMYINQIERIGKKYFYSVNRANFKKDKYNAPGYYNINFSKHWITKIYNYTHTYQIEFLGRLQKK